MIKDYSIVTQAIQVKEFKEFKEVKKNYSDLINCTTEIYFNNQDKKIHSKYLEEYVDFRPLKINIANHNKAIDDYQQYNINIVESIESFLGKDEYLDGEKVKKYLDFNNEILIEEKEDLEVENLGTTLNMLRDYYTDLLIGLKRMNLKTHTHNINKKNSIICSDKIIIDLPKSSKRNDSEYDTGYQFDLNRI